VDSGDTFPMRHRPIHLPSLEQGNRSTIVFLTVCTHDRRALLANESVHAHLRSVWQQATHWHVGRYVVMPNHVHLFCAPGAHPPPPLAQWVKFWKSRAAATWPGPAIGKVWQTDYWDTQLRAGDSYAAKWIYVQDNPVRAGLVARGEAWPWQGEMTLLRWSE
jgi:putative transposase